tara:strand:- start:309 stop:938 length:630 start_codon:yes stop_codon:yes gene_type:complete
LVSWTAPEADEYFVHTLGSEGDLVVYAFDGCDGAELGCSQDFLGHGLGVGLTLDLDAQQQILIGIDDLPINDGVELHVFGRRRDCQDLDLNALMLDGPVQSSNDMATTRYAASCGQMTAQMAYRFEAPQAGLYRFDTAGSQFDTVLELLSEDCGPTIACSDDVDGLQSRLEHEMAQGDVVTVVVGGYRLNRGAFTLSAERLDADPDGPD